MSFITPNIFCTNRVIKNTVALDFFKDRALLSFLDNIGQEVVVRSIRQLATPCFYLVMNSPHYDRLTKECSKYSKNLSMSGFLRVPFALTKFSVASGANNGSSIHAAP